MQTNQTMKSIITTYPGFHDLPKGVRKLLLNSETFFFDEPHPEANPMNLNNSAISSNEWGAHAIPVRFSLGANGPTAYPAA
jgi:hypothetical protein